MTESKHCKQCGKIFFKNKQYSKKYWERQKYCSQKCAGDAWKGTPAWNKGKKGLCFSKKPQEYLNWKPSYGMKGKKMSIETKRKISESHKGEKSSQWKGGISKTREYNSVYKKRHRARKKNAEGSHTSGEWELLRKQYGFTCPACKRKEPIIQLTEDHIIPLAKGGSDYIENIQPLCRGCNSKKHTKIVKF